MNYFKTTIEEIVDNLKLNKEDDCKTAVLLGAGMSVTAGIPTANGLMKYIEDKLPHTVSSCRNKTYQNYMQCLAPQQRRNLIAQFVDNAKINLAHLYLGVLIKEGYIDRVLTTNFDNLIIRTLALFNIFPAIYDLAVSQTFIPEETAQLSIFYLHGQRNGYRILNTDSELNESNKLNHFRDLFYDTAQRRSWLVIGYSGENDPIFKRLSEIDIFRNKLFWVGYKENEPKEYILQKILNPKEKYGYYLKGFDADEFFLNLVRKLQLPEPQILSNPFTHLKEEIDNIGRQFKIPESLLNQSDLGLKSNKLIDPTATVRKWTSIAIKGFEEELGFNNLEGAKKEDIKKEKIIQKSQNIDLNQRFNIIDSQFINEIRSSKSKEAIDNIVHSLSDWGLRLANDAAKKQGKEANNLYDESIKKFKVALDIKPNDYEVINNLGIVYAEMAKRDGNNDFLDFQKAFQEFDRSLLIKPRYFKALYNWGTILFQVAQKKEGSEKEKLFNETLNKFKLIEESKQKDPKILNNYTIVLLELARLKKGEEKENLLKQALEKSKMLHKIENGKSDKALLTWGIELLEFSTIKGKNKQEELIREAIDKFKKSINMNNNNPDAYNNLGIAYLGLAKLKSGEEKENLLRKAIDKFILIEEGKLPEKSFNIACAHSLLNNNKDAIIWLEKFLTNNKVSKSVLLNEEDFNNIKNSEDFKNLLQKYYPNEK